MTRTKLYVNMLKHCEDKSSLPVCHPYREISCAVWYIKRTALSDPSLISLKETPKIVTSRNDTRSSTIRISKLFIQEQMKMNIMVTSWLTTLIVLVCMCCARHARVCPPALMQPSERLYLSLWKVSVLPLSSLWWSTNKPKSAMLEHWCI